MVGKTKSSKVMELSSDSESSPVRVRESRKVKKHKHRISDVESVNVLHDGHNGKHHRHRCHHHNHHRHGHIHSSGVKEGRVHKQKCSKHNISLQVVQVKKEPMDENDDQIAR
jgi:hypothetical protein